jgi:hypothetical protein
MIQYRNRQFGQVQAEEMSPGVQEVLPGGADWQTLHRSRSREQNRLHL